VIDYAMFPGDDDQRIIDVQIACYLEIVASIVRGAGRAFLNAEAIVRTQGPMSIQVRQLDAVDHRTVQGMHDLIAGWYRFRRRTERLFPLGDGIADDWRWFAGKEIVELCREGDFVTGVLDAVILANTERGYEGEARATEVQKQRYRAMLAYRLPAPENTSS
jgi:hypothetical protein